MMACRYTSLWSALEVTGQSSMFKVQGSELRVGVTGFESLSLTAWVGFSIHLPLVGTRSDGGRVQGSRFRV